MTEAQAPAEWKNYDDFASGIATNRLPATNAIAGKNFALTFEDGRKLQLNFRTAFENTLESLTEVYKNLPADWKMFVEYEGI